MSKASSINANMLLPSVVGAYEAIYPSKILPVREGWQAPDALADLVSMAHERKIEVCPYIACFHPIAKEDISKSFYAEHQERLSVRHPKDLSADQRFPDPANPQVRQLLADVAAEIVSKYEVDGLGLDYIRYYDHQAMCYCTACRAAIRERFGFDPLAGNPVEDKSHWESLKEWRVEQITATVRAVRDAVKALKPGVKLYACVISDPDYARQGFGQDWADFAQYLDFIVPMNYGWVGLDEGLLRRQAQTLSGKTLFFPAIGGMPPEHAAFTPDDWITMINLARGVGAEGIAIYALRYIRPEVCALLRATAFKEPALLPTRGQ